MMHMCLKIMKPDIGEQKQSESINLTTRIRAICSHKLWSTSDINTDIIMIISCKLILDIVMYCQIHIKYLIDSLTCWILNAIDREYYAFSVLSKKPALFITLLKLAHRIIRIVVAGINTLDQFFKNENITHDIHCRLLHHLNTKTQKHIEIDSSMRKINFRNFDKMCRCSILIDYDVVNWITRYETFAGLSIVVDPFEKIGVLTRSEQKRMIYKY